MGRYERTADPVYWMQELQKLLRTARDSGLEISYKELFNNVRIQFRNDIGETTGVSVEKTF